MIAYVVLLILSGFLASTTGGKVVWFFIMGIFAIPPIVVGPKRYRVIGIIALLIAIVATATDYRAGKKIEDRILIKYRDTTREKPAQPADKP